MTSTTGRLDAALSGRYRIERQLGQGGMATVYLASDLKHDRKVALKVLKPELSAVLGADRFVVEIKTTASLQHPHILPLFDSGSADGFLYYVMPYVEGETLRDKLRRETQFSVEEAVRITRDVADALDYAHRHGVVHRDVKPENILLHDGRPTVADFGIALAVSAAAGGRMTETGLSLGTPHYMSPEQATAEKEITARSDIYSLASVLYEMLAGQPPHMGGSAQQIIMKIIAEPVAAVTNFRKSVPPHVAAAVAKALEKLPADRFSSAREFMDALGNPAFALDPRARVVGAGRASSAWKERAAIPLAAAAGLAIALAVWEWSRGAPSAPVLRLPIELPDSAGLQYQLGTLFALTADGSRLVYVGPGEGDVDLWERPLNSLTANRIPETNGADSPFLTPDGNDVAFYRANPPRVFTVSLRGGPRQTWAQDSTVPLGGDFGPDGALYFVRRNGIRRVRTPGGPVEAVTTVDPSAERSHAWVDVLPSGKGAVFTIVRARTEQNDIAAVDLKSGNTKVIMRGTYARYSPTGHLVYVDAGGGLFAIAFDESSLTTRGPAVPMVAGVSRGESGVGYVAVSETGLLLYAAGDAAVSDELLFVDRRGGNAPIDTAMTGQFGQVAVSPNGSRIAASILDGSGVNIWIKDLPAGPVLKLTLEGDNLSPSWSPDGRLVYFVSERGGRAAALYGRRADASANDYVVLQTDRPMRNAAITADGQWVVYHALGDIFLRRLAGADTATKAIIATQAAEVDPRLSPDGRWLAYVSNESGVPEVYVNPFPTVSASRTLVSLGGGTEPRWSATGRELFYEGRPGQSLIAAQVDLSPTFRVRERTRLFDRAAYTGTTTGGTYDRMPDGGRFVMYRARSASSRQLVLLQNWNAELGRRSR